MANSMATMLTMAVVVIIQNSKGAAATSLEETLLNLTAAFNPDSSTWADGAWTGGDNLNFEDAGVSGCGQCMYSHHVRMHTVSSLTSDTTIGRLRHGTNGARVSGRAHSTHHAQILLEELRGRSDVSKTNALHGTALLCVRTSCVNGIRSVLSVHQAVFLPPTSNLPRVLTSPPCLLTSPPRLPPTLALLLLLPIWSIKIPS